MKALLLTDSITSNIERALRYAMLWGVEGVTLRMVESARVPHINESKVRNQLDNTEMTLAAISPGLFEADVRERLTVLNDLMLLDETLSFCKRFDCSLVLVSGFAMPDTGDALTLCLEKAADLLQKAGARAEKQGVSLAVMNELGGLVPTGTALAGLLAQVAHPFVKAAWSPVDALRAGEPQNIGIQAIAPHTIYVQAQDGRFKKSHWEPSVFGEGEIDWRMQLSTLHHAGFSGGIALNLEVEPKAKAGLYGATALIKTIRQARKS